MSALGLKLDVRKRINLKKLGCQLCNLLKTYVKKNVFADLSFLKQYLHRKVQEKPSNSTFFDP